MITIPIAVYNDSFKFQLELFWFKHKELYGDLASSKTLAIIIKRNNTFEYFDEYKWNIDIPYQLCNGVCEYGYDGNYLPLNIQLGLESVINNFKDDDVIELIDCDMFHLEKRNFDGMQHDVLFCDNIYEDWHLKSLSDNKHVIERYFENNGKYYNGGFVPIIATALTFKKILHEWKAVHIDIVKNTKDSNIIWWAGMYSLQSACEKNKVQMINFNNCYIPPINNIQNKSIAHYSVDNVYINKKQMLFTEEIIDDYTKSIVNFNKYVKFRNNSNQ